MFEMDDNGQCLKADGHNIYIVRLNVPKDKKYFKVSFMFKVVRLYNHSFTFASIYEKNEGCVGYTFKMNPNLNNDAWNYVEFDVQDNVCVQKVNKGLSMFYVKINRADTYTIQTTGMIAKIDNLRIQETKKNVDEDYSNVINLSKEF